MKRLLVSYIILFLLIGCGYNPESPVYDTTNNPKKFPAEAISLLEMFDVNEKFSVDSVIEAFTFLYMDQPELLDNKDWKDVVGLLGIKFRYMADQMVKNGLKNYTSTSSYYSLAAFARPNDMKIKIKNELFNSWKGEKAETLDEYWSKLRKKDIEPDEISKLIFHFKNFYFQSKNHSAFADSYLKDEILTFAITNYNLSLDSLSFSDQAFLDYLNIKDINFDKAAAKFERPRIDLIAYEIVLLDSLVYRVELYFQPSQTIEYDYKIAFWIDQIDSLDFILHKSSGYVPMDFYPESSTSSWVADKIAICEKTFNFMGPIDTLSIGLYSQKEGQVSYIPIVGSGASLIRIPAIIH